MSVATTEGQLRYLTAPLAAVARRHLEGDERVLTAIYVEHVMRVVTRGVFGLIQRRPYASSPNAARIIRPAGRN